MSFSRRAFLRGLPGNSAGPVSGAIVAARGREAMLGETLEASFWEPAMVPQPEADVIRLSSNENPLGPGEVALDALIGEFHQTGRYPFNSRKSSADLTDALAKEFHAKPENIVLGAGSTEILRNAVRAFTSADRGLVTADPSFEVPVRTAELIGTPIHSAPVDSEYRLNLEAMAWAAKGAGLVFLCNPNNPTATVHSSRAIAEFVSTVRRESPQTVILIDEAYHEYVTDARYRTAVPLALNHPGVFVSRTFSKAYGMAGLRVGYAVGQKETIQRLGRFKLNYNVNVLGIAAALASFNDAGHLVREKNRNAEVRDFTSEFFRKAGYESAKSQTNFVFVNIGRPAKDFAEECKKLKVEVGREFPPFEKTHARISIGTMQEMKKATEVFRKVLGQKSTDTAQPN